MFNIKHGKLPWDNRPHGRMVGDAPFTHKVGKTANKTVPVEAMMMETWDALGYDRETSIPKDETREALGLPYLMNAPEEEFVNA